MALRLTAEIEYPLPVRRCPSLPCHPSLNRDLVKARNDAGGQLDVIVVAIKNQRSCSVKDRTTHDDAVSVAGYIVRIRLERISVKQGRRRSGLQEQESNCGDNPKVFIATFTAR